METTNNYYEKKRRLMINLEDKIKRLRKLNINGLYYAYAKEFGFSDKQVDKAISILAGAGVCKVKGDEVIAL